MTQRIWTSIKTLPFVCAVGLAGQAQAQEATTPQASKGPLEEVVVTAQRREEKINEIGMAIQAFSGDALEKLAVATVNDLQNVVPSFSVTQGYQGVPIYTLRGVGFNTLNFSATSTVGTYIDEAAYAYPIMNTGPIFDVERVEVLKGPQGTLYGRNTTGGLIDVITNKPTKDFQSSVGVDVGNYETYNAEGFVSGPLFGDWIQGRLAFRTENTGRGYQESVTRPGDRLGEKEKYGVRGSLSLQPTDTTKIDFSVNWFKNNSATLSAQSFAFAPAVDPNVKLPNAMGVLTASAFSASNNPALYGPNMTFGLSQPHDNRNTDFTPQAMREANAGSTFGSSAAGDGVGGPLRENNPFTGLKLRVEQGINDDVRLVSLTNYNYFKRDALSDFSGAPIEISLQQLKGKINSFAEDLHFEGQTKGGINWLAGAYYANDRILDTNRTLVDQNVNVLGIRALATQVLGADSINLGNGLSPLGFPVNTFNPNGNTFTQSDIDNGFRQFKDSGTIRTQSYSFFANGDAPLTDSLKLTLGARYTNEVQNFAGCSRDYNGSLIATEALANRFLFATQDPTSPFFGQVAQMFNTPNGCVTFDSRTNTYGIVTSKLDQNNVSWRSGLDWKATDNVLLYTTISRGYKGGTTPLNASNSAVQNAPVGQEKLTAYEIGTKAGLFDRRVQANVSTFYYDYKDKQINTFFNDPIFQVLAHLDNVPKSALYGIDADVTWRATDSISLNLNALGLHSEVKEYIGTDQFGRTTDFSGTEFPDTPKWMVASTIYYQHELAAWNFNAALNARYQKASSAALVGAPVQGYDNTIFDIPGFTTVNGSAGVTSPDGTWQIGVFARNLLDRYYYQSIASNANTVVRFAAEPRTFGLTATKRF